MRKELENIQTIEKYLQGKMSADEKKAFEQKLSTDKKLQEEVKLQQEVMEGLKGASLKMKAKKAYKKYTIGKAVLKTALITGGTIVILAAGYLGYKALTKDKSNTDEQSAYVLPELNENGEKIWADADKYLPYQKFTINAQKDTVVETEDGIVMAIPANCFLDKNGKPVEGEITFEVKEAIEANDIMKAGLNTKSGDQLLETGGMFYINARKGEESLAIDPKKGVYTEVPTNEINPDMQLFEGKRMPNGSIDWVNPKPIEKFLVPVNINTLNFYPPEYEDSLAAMGKDVNNKIYKDSLYYSFARLFNKKNSDKGELNSSESGIKEFNTILPNLMLLPQISFATSDTTVLDEITSIPGINPSKIKAIWNKKFENTLIATREFEERCKLIHRTCNNAVLDGM